MNDPARGSNEGRVRCRVDSPAFSLQYGCMQPYVDVSATPEHASTGWARDKLCTAPLRFFGRVPIRKGYNWSCTRTRPEATKSAPLVAHCSAGLARTFVHPLVHQSFRHHLVNGFGGRAAVFLLLKTFDARKTAKALFPANPADDHIDDFDEEKQQQLRRSLEFVRPQAVVLEHSSTPTINPWCRMGSADNRSVLHAYGTEAGMVRHVGHMEASRRCLELIVRHEAVHGIAFDWVTRSRPDLAYMAPMYPHGAFLAGGSRAYVSQKDYFYVFTRDAAEIVLDVHRWYRKCNGSAWWPYSAYESLLRIGARKRGIEFREANLPIGTATWLGTQGAIPRACSSTAISFPASCLPLRYGRAGEMCFGPRQHALPCYMDVAIKAPRLLLGCGDHGEQERLCRQIPMNYTMGLLHYS